MGRLCCINLDGHVIYSYHISGVLGLAVDQQGRVYISGAACPQNIKNLHQQNIKIFYLQNIKIPHLQNIKIFHLQL
jgi:hypothetical protein